MTNPDISAPTLLSLLGVVQRAGIQAESLRLIYNQPGATSELIDNVCRDLEHCYERLHDELQILERFEEHEQ